jgi:hypothetical protein
MSQTAIVRLGGDLRAGVTYEHDIDGCDLSNLHHGRAYARSPDIAKLKADAENVVEIISGDKGKIEAYCEFAELSDQIDEANEDGDTKKLRSYLKR